MLSGTGGKQVMALLKELYAFKDQDKEAEE